MERLIGRRVQLIRMNDDPHPIQPGSRGTITRFAAGVLEVKWDNGRTLGLIVGVDEYKILKPANSSQYEQKQTHL